MKFWLEGKLRMTSESGLRKKNGNSKGRGDIAKRRGEGLQGRKSSYMEKKPPSTLENKR